MSANDNSSTLKSYVDSATGVVQSAIGSLTGSTADQAQGDQKQDKASVESDLSHSVGKVGPYAVSGSGGVSKDDPNRSAGSWNQTVGSSKEAVGGLVGSQDLKSAGARQNREGKGQEAEGQANDFGSGVADRVTGAAGAAFAGLTGDKVGQERYQAQHDVGKTQQRSAEADIRKQSQ